jgi:hypothetical protein
VDSPIDNSHSNKISDIGRKALAPVIMADRCPEQLSTKVVAKGFYRGIRPATFEVWEHIILSPSLGLQVPSLSPNLTIPNKLLKTKN